MIRLFGGFLLRKKSDKACDDPPGDKGESKTKPNEKKVSLEELEKACDDPDPKELSSKKPYKVEARSIDKIKTDKNDDDACEQDLEKATIREKPKQLKHDSKPTDAKCKEKVDLKDIIDKEKAKKAEEYYNKNEKIPTDFKKDDDCKGPIKEALRQASKSPNLDNAVCDDKRKEELPALDSYEVKKKKKEANWKAITANIMAEYDKICKNVVQKGQAPLGKKGPSINMKNIAAKYKDFGKKMPTLEEFQKMFTFAAKPPPGPPRPMKYAYTFTAKMVQFPYRYYIANVWMYKYFLIAGVVSLPFFWKMQQMSYSPANVARWDEIRDRDFGITPHKH